jgi:hypothetical protein
MRSRYQRVHHRSLLVSNIATFTQLFLGIDDLPFALRSNTFSIPVFPGFSRHLHFDDLSTTVDVPLRYDWLTPYRCH